MAVVLVAIVVVVDGGDVCRRCSLLFLLMVKVMLANVTVAVGVLVVIVGNEGDVGRAYPHAGWYRGIVGVDCPRRWFSSETGFSTPLTLLPSRRFGNPRMRDFEPDT